MGEANKRGSYEQRMQQSVERLLLNRTEKLGQVRIKADGKMIMPSQLKVKRPHPDSRKLKALEYNRARRMAVLVQRQIIKSQG